MLLALGQTPTLAATINVGGGCNLVNAITAANTDAASGGCRAGNGADIIVLPRNSTQTLTRVNNRDNGPSGLPIIDSRITINGRGSTIRRSNGARNFRIFSVGSEGNLTLQQTTVSGGKLTSANGGGSTYGNDGGAVFNYGTLTVNRTTISGNRAVQGGGVGTYGVALNVINSTISSNRAITNGGGVYNYLTNVTLRHSTLSGNTAASGGGVYGFYAKVFLQRSLISGNIAASGAEVYYDESSTFTNANFNVFGHRGLTNAQAFEGFTAGVTDITATSDGNTPTRLRAILETNLANNGGTTQTHALVRGSPAIDTVTDGTCPPPGRDQRGVKRPQDGNGDGAAICDTGSFERRPGE